MNSSRELQNKAALLDGFAGRDVADPIVRQVGADQDEIADRERADVVADIAVARRRGHEVDFVFGMVSASGPCERDSRATKP